MLPFHSSQVASDFSNYQLSKLMQRSRTSQKLADVRKVLRSSETAVIGLSEESKVHEVEASRIMSSDSAHYILVKGRELESSSQEDSLSQSSMEFPVIGESESDRDRRREEEEEGEKVVMVEEGEKVVMVEEGEKVVMVEEGEKVVMVEEGEVVMVEEGEKVVMVEEGEKVVMVEEGEKVVMVEEGEKVVMVEEGEKVVMVEEGEKVVMVEEGEKVVMVEEGEKVVMVEEGEKVVMVEEGEKVVMEEGEKVVMVEEGEKVVMVEEGEKVVMVEEGEKVVMVEEGEKVVMVEEGEKVVMVEEGEKVVMVEEGEKVVMVEEGEKVVMVEEGEKVVMVEEGEKVVMVEEGEKVVMVEEGEKVVMVEEGEKVVMVEEGEKVVMEFPAIGESESDMDRRREEEEEEEEEEVMVEEEEAKAVTESVWNVVESEPHKSEETVRTTCELLESAATVCKPLSSMVTSEQREEASQALSQETDRSNLPVEPAASVVSEIEATFRESSSPTVASVSERETTSTENCLLTSVVASASEMQGTPEVEEKSSPVVHVSTSEGVAASQPCEKLRGVREVLRDGRSFVEGVEEERRLHLEEQLEREGEEEKEVKEEEGKEDRVKGESGKEEKLEEGKKEDGWKEDGGTPQQAVTIASSVTELEGSNSTLEEDNSASHLEEIEPADADIHEGQTGIIDHGSSGKLDTTRLRTNPSETEWTKVVQLVGSRGREEGVREGVTTEINQSEVRVLEDQVGYISDSESGQLVSGLRSVYQLIPSLASPGEHHIHVHVHSK